MKTKIFAAYLPQYHETEDNDMFWGKGFTDWVSVKKAQPQYSGHNQPRHPQNDDYYDLLDVKTIERQAKLAKEYCIDGFNIYHYWFKDGKQELEKPAELLLEHTEIDISFFFSWDNASWKRSWDNVQGNDWAPAFDTNQAATGKNGLLVEFQYGDETQWKKHFDYLLPFFQDERYYKLDGKPVFFFMGCSEEETLKKMGDCWNKWALEAGFNGMFLATKRKNFFSKRIFNAEFCYEPETSAWGKRRAIDSRLSQKLGVNTKRDYPVKYMYKYEKVWKRILKHARRNANDIIIGSFVRYDDTPRRGKEAMIVTGESPQKFREFFNDLYNICCRNSAKFLLLTAWNEWGEGAYLEPDEDDGLAYLEAIKSVVMSK